MKKSPSSCAGAEVADKAKKETYEDTPCGLSGPSIHSAQLGEKPCLRETPALLDHLQQFEYEPEVLDAPDDGFVPVKKLKAAELLDAQVKTADWLKELGVEDDEQVITQAQEETAVQAFTALTTGAPDPKTAVSNLQVPAAVRKTVAMLTAYNWKFVEQAQEIRGKAVHQLLDEMEHPDARIRLKAIELLGKVTEIGLFTERVSVKKEELDDHELDNRIREKLAQLNKTVEVEAKEREERNADAEDVDVQGEEDESKPS